jgi:UDP-GlcNAc3NAcA epimerase
MKIATIVGARPQFIKAAAMSRELRKRHQEILIHTGQHYDHAMSGAFFEGLEMPVPEFNLSIGSGSHGAQTGAMLKGIEEVLISSRPDWVLVYGDTNSTMAGALAAAKLHIPVVHVEAGLRSFNRAMPEEINRVVTDHVSELLLCPSKISVENLANEGVERGVHIVGDIMLDILNWARERALDQRQPLLNRLFLNSGKFILATMHRSENTDNPENLSGILQAFNSVKEPIVFPAHPRTRKAIEAVQAKLGANVQLVEPLGYFDMINLSQSARLILTDSGGLQKEAYWLGVPCITLRNETEWVETVEAGWNVLAGADSKKIIELVRSFSPPSHRPALYGEGVVAQACVEVLESAGGARLAAGKPVAQLA